MKYNVKIGRFQKKDKSGYYVAMYVDLGYKNVFITFDYGVMAELLDITLKQLQTLTCDLGVTDDCITVGSLDIITKTAA